MRIGFVTGEYPPMRGGVGDYTRALAGAVITAGHAVYILSDRRGIGDSTPGVTVEAAITRWNVNSLLTIRQWARRHDLNVVNVQFETAAYASLLPIHFWPHALNGLPIMTVTTYHDLIAPYLFRYAGRLRNSALWTMGRASHGVIATNAGDAIGLRQALPHTPIAEIPIGSNIPTQPPANFSIGDWRAAHHFASDIFLIGYFGFLNPSKGLELLIDGLKTAVYNGINAQVVMIGGGATESDSTQRAYIESLRARIAASNLADRVHWTGFATPAEVSAWLLACDLIALPFADGVSLRRGSFMAAIAHGCPILTTAPIDPIDGLEDSVAFVPRADLTAFTTALIDLSRDQARRSALGTAARLFARRFTWDAIAAQTIAFYAQLDSRKT